MQKDEMPNKTPQPTKKTILIFGAVTALFIGVMGYEFIRENEPKNPTALPERKLLFTSKLQHQLLEKPDRIELKLLSAQNRHFSDKIIALKEEAHENSKRLHALQLTSFATQKAKANKEAEELRRKIEASEMVSAELQYKLANLQSHLQNKELQVLDMEVNLDALNELFAEQKQHKLDSHARFKQQMEAFQNETAAEKEYLLRLISELEASETALKMQLEQHYAEIEKLERELDHVSLMALDKEIEADFLKEDMKSEKIEIISDAKALSLLIETEQLAVKHLQKELHYTESELAAKVGKLNDMELALESDQKDQMLQARIDEIKQKDEIFNSSQISFNDFKEKSHEEFQKAHKTAFEQEQKLIENLVARVGELSLHEEVAAIFLNDLEESQAELYQLKQLHHALSHDRNALKNQLDEKNHRMTALDNAQETLQKLLSEANELLLTREQELKETKEMALLYESSNEVLSENHETLQKLFTEIDQLLQAREHELAEMKEIALLKDQSNEELKELLLHHEDRSAELELHKRQATESNEKIKRKLDLYTKALDEALIWQELQKQTVNQLENEMAFLKLQSDENFEQLLQDHKNIHSSLNLKYVESTSLNDQMKQELENYAEALSEAYALQEFQKQTVSQLEEDIALLKLQSDEKISKLLTDHENERLYFKSNHAEAAALNDQISQELAQKGEALSEASTLQEFQKHTISKLEEEIALLKLQSDEKLNQLLTDHENERLYFTSNHAEAAALNDQLRQELARHSEALSEASSVQEFQKQTISKLEEDIALLKLQSDEKLNQLLTTHENERLYFTSNHAEAAALNDQMRQELARLSEALSEASTQYEFQKQTISKLEADIALLKLQSDEKLNQLLTAHENERHSLTTNHAEAAALNDQMRQELARHSEALSEASSVQEFQKQTISKLEEDIALLKLQSDEKLNQLLTDHENERAYFKLNYSEATSLNKKIQDELVLYSKALDEALVLQEVQKQAAIQLESELEQLNVFLKSKTEELADAKNAFGDKNLENEQLEKEVQKQQELFKAALYQYEEAQKNANKNESDLNQLTELLLHRERELDEMKQIFQETLSSNDELYEKIEKQQKTLGSSLQNYQEAENRAIDAESSLLSLSERLKKQEDELLQTKNFNSDIKAQNEVLANQIHHHREELAHTLQLYRAAQEKTEDNELQIRTLIETLTHKEQELLKVIKEKQAENSEEQKPELDQTQTDYSLFLNTNQKKETLKFHKITSGETLMGISLRYYGTPNRWKEIYQANNQIISDQNKIPAGRIITIP